MTAASEDRRGAMRTHAMWLAGATGVVLLAMVALGLTTGAAQEPHEHFMAPDAYVASLFAHVGALRVMFALDIAFLVLYTAFFIAFAEVLREQARPFVNLALAAMIATALLDIVEDHHIVAMLESAEHGIVPSASSIMFQAAESATKFSVSYLGLVLFGLAVPRTTKLGIALFAFLVVGTLISAIVGYSVPPDVQPKVESGRWIGFLVGFGLAFAWLRQVRQVGTEGTGS